MSVTDTEDQARRRAVRLEKMKIQQDRADEVTIEQRKADEAREQKTARLRAMRLAAEAEAARPQGDIASTEAPPAASGMAKPRKTAAAKPVRKTRRAVTG